MGLSENRVYSQWNSHLIGFLIINHWVKRGTLFSDKPTSSPHSCWELLISQFALPHPRRRNTTGFTRCCVWGYNKPYPKSVPTTRHHFWSSKSPSLAPCTIHQFVINWTFFPSIPGKFSSHSPVFSQYFSWNKLPFPILWRPATAKESSREFSS